MSVSLRLVAFVAFALVMFAGPHAARAARDAGTIDACAGSRQVLVSPPPGSDAGPQSVDALELIRVLSKQNDELKELNGSLRDQMKSLTADQNRKNNEVEEKLERLEHGGDGGAGGPAGWSWAEAAALVAVGFIVGLMVARRKGTERDA